MISTKISQWLTVFHRATSALVAVGMVMSLACVGMSSASADTQNYNPYVTDGGHRVNLNGVMYQTDSNGYLMSSANPSLYTGPALFLLRNANSMLYLDTATSANGAQVIQSDPQGQIGGPNTSSTWKIWMQSNATFHIVNAVSGLAIGISGGFKNAGQPAIQWTGTTGADQQWSLQPKTPNPHPDYAPLNTLQNVNSTQFLAIGNAAGQPGAGAIQWPSTGGAEQAWYVIQTW